MNARIAILAALPRELAPLVRDWPTRSTSRREGFRVAECDRAIAVSAGMGAERVTRALEIASGRGPLSEIVSAGYAGALRPSIAACTLFWPAEVVDARTGDRFVCQQGSGTLVSTDHVVDHEEKLLLAGRWNADLVDMEAATVARLARERGLPFRTLRVVSDEAEEVLPDFNRFMDARGGFRGAAFAAYLLARPWLIPAAMRMGRRATQAAHGMAKELRLLLRQKR
ncbi:MAG: phosphorylase family protein [Acidobacteriaceae bacterium]